MPEPPAVSEPIPGTAIDATEATVAALRAALAAGTLTARGLTAFYLGRIERLDPLLHSVNTVSGAAPAEAQACDEARAGGAPAGPLAGIPVLIKDNIAVRGMPATAGSPALAGAEQGDAWLVSRLREAGAVILGKANLSEWANFRSSHPTSGWSTLGGQAANPHALDRNPSGSSSGSAVAAAAGLAAITVGTETDGSIVCPASACGIVGLKPTLGLVSRGGIVPISLAQDTAGPITRSVADAAALLSAMVGPDPGDPATAAAAGRTGGYTAYLVAGALAGARLGVWREGSKAAGAATTAVLEAALEQLAGLGADLVDPVDLPGADQIEEPELAAMLAEFRHDLNAYLAALAGEHPATLAELIAYNRDHGERVLARFGQELFEQAEATGGDLGDAGYLAAREEAARRAREALDGPLTAHQLDAIVALTANQACLTDYHLGDHDVFHTSGPAAVAGFPAISVPAGGVSGLPVGLSFIGPRWSEPRLIALAYAFEQAAGARLIPALRATCPPPGANGLRGPQG